MTAIKRWCLFALLLTAACASAGSPGLLLVVEQPDLAWSNETLAERLIGRLSLKANQPVLMIADTDTLFPGAGATVDDLTAWGRELGAQGLLIVTVTGERLERRKSFQVPLVFHKWETIGVLEGQYRLLDLQRGRTIVAEPFVIELHGPRAIQGTMDDNADDPDIHLRAQEKLLFFAQLENKLIDQLAERAQPLINRHDREAYAQKTKGR